MWGNPGSQGYLLEVYRPMISPILQLNPDKISSSARSQSYQPSILAAPVSGWVYYFKKFILPSSLSATAVGAAEEFGEVDGKKKRPGDLSLYDEPEEKSPEEKEKESLLEKEIGKIREEVWVWYDHVKGYREKVVEVVVTAKEHSGVLVQSLRNDELPVPRSGAIAIGGLAGFILGLRGGWMKRIFYGSTCAGIMAAICYPGETKQLSEDALAITKKYVLISYNFIYGEKESSGISVGVSPSEDSPPVPEPNSAYNSSPKLDSSSSPFPSLSNPTDAPQDQDKGPTSNTVTDNLVEESADIVYWGFRLREKKKPPQNDQSDPGDKDLYTNRK